MHRPRAWEWVVGFAGLALLLALAACGSVGGPADAAGPDVPVADGLAEDLPVLDLAAELPAADVPADELHAPDLPPLSPTFRFAVVSDTHVRLADDPHNTAFAAAGATFAALDPPPDFVVSTGDDVDDLFTIPGVIEAGDPVEVLGVYRGLIQANYPMSFHVVKGNHDNRFFDTFEGNLLPDQAWAQAFAGTPFYPSPWYAFDHRGFHFVVLDSTDGATDHATNDTPTILPAQAEWLESQLATTQPTILFWHHWIPLPAQGETPHPILGAIQRHKTVVRAAFMGHQHAFATYVWEGVQFFQTPPLYEAGVTWHEVECDTVNGSVRIANPDPITYPP
jgi:hypothetical protein